MFPFRLTGYAIISDDDCIADADGNMPTVLMNEADWRYFQAGLDRAALVLIGRHGHEAHPNPPHRRRLVLTSTVDGFTRDPDQADIGEVFRVNPAVVPLAEALARLVKPGAEVAVPGGRLVFDACLDLGFDAFHLARKRGARLKGGVKILSACQDGTRPEAVLAGHGLEPAETIALDPTARVDLVVHRRPVSGG